MKLEEIIRLYVSPIQRFDHILPNNYQAEDIYNHYKKQAKFYEIESFTNVRFNRKFKEIATSIEEQNWLNNKAKQIAELAQQMFQRKFPQFYVKE